MKKYLVPILAALLPLVLSASDILWRVGEFDGSSDEFNQGMRSPSVKVNYVVGKSEAGKHWGGSQPVKTAKSLPRQISFNMANAPKSGAVYHLKASLLVERANVPIMEIVINGKRGWYYLHPRLDNRMGDSPGGNRTVYSHYDLIVEIPAALLKKGGNTISFQPLAQWDEFVPDAAINYDAIEFALAPEAPALPLLAARVVPTVFYKNIKGALHEQIDVFVRTYSNHGKGSVELKLEGKTYKQDMKLANDLGEEHLTFMIPEFSGEKTAELRVVVDGKELRSTQTIRPEKKWTVLVIPNVHLDIGYTDHQTKVAVLQARLLESAIDLTDNNPDFRFSIDGSWTLQQFMRMRNEREQQRLIKAMQEKRIYVPAQSASLLTGFPTAETLLRSFYVSANFAREHGTPLNYTASSDVPSPVWSYASVMASAGLKYFISGSNSDRGPIVLVGRYNEFSPMWWEGPDGKRVLFWYSRVYRQAQMTFGLPPIVDAGRDMLPVFLQAFSRPHYTASTVLMWGTQGENRELFPQQATLAERWNKEYAYPRLQYSGVADAVQRIADELGDNVPVVRGCGGGYWEDGLAANPLRIGIQRGTERRAISAEKLVTLSALVNTRLRVDKGQLETMWDNMLLYDEHTQVVSNSMPEHDTIKTTGQLEIKNLYADTAANLAKQLVMEGGANLAASMNVERGDVVVYNTLNWNRDGLITFDLGNNSELYDQETGGKVSFDITSRGANFRRVNLLVKDIPAMGYKILKPRSATTKEDTAEEVTMNIEDYQDRERGIDVRPPRDIQQKNPATVMENKFYRVELDAESGAVKSIYDKELGRELVDKESPYKFGLYVYVTGGDAKPNGILQYQKKAPELTVNISREGKIVYVRKIPFGQKARLESSAIYTPKIITEIRLWDDKKKIEFINEVRKDQVYRREGVYFAFPFAMKEPQFLYEIQNGVVDPNKDIIPGGCQEWHMVQNWVGVQENGLAGVVVPIDAPLMTLGDIIRGTWPMEFGKRPGVIFSHVVNNYHQPRTIIDFRPEVKEDRLTFRYVVTSDTKIEPVKLSKLGWEEMTPLEWSHVQPQDKSWVRAQPLNEQKWSFVDIKDDAIVLTAVKQAEDGRGIILRFLDMGAEPRRVTVRFPVLKLKSVKLTDGVERDLSDIKMSGEHEFSFDIKTNEIITIRIEGGPALRARDPRDGMDDAGGLTSPFGDGA